MQYQVYTFNFHYNLTTSISFFRCRCLPPSSTTKGPDSPGRVPNFDPHRWQSTTDDRFNSSRKHGAFWKKDPSSCVSFITLSHFRSSNWTSWCNSRTCDILGICATAMTVLPASKCSISCEKPDRFTPISIQGILIKSRSSWSKKQHLSNKSTDSNSDSSSPKLQGSSWFITQASPTHHLFMTL